MRAEIIANYIAAFAAANTMNEPPSVQYERGWYRISGLRGTSRGYRRAEIIAMTERLRERAKQSPQERGGAV